MWVRNNKDLPVFFTKSKTSKGISAKRTPVIMLKLIAIVDTHTKKKYSTEVFVLVYITVQINTDPKQFKPADRIQKQERKKHVWL